MPRHLRLSALTAALLSSALMFSLSGCSRDESTPTLLAEAKQYQEKGDLKAALIQLKNAVAKSPDDVNARMQLGLLSLETGDLASAEKELRRAAGLGAPTEQVLPPLARALHAQGKYKESLDELTPEKVAKSAALLALRGDALLASEKPDEAKQAYEQALALEPGSGKALNGLARHALLAGKSEEGERLAVEATQKDASNPDVWMFRGALLRASGKHDEALAAYIKATDLRPSDVPARIEQAYLYINKRDYAKAKSAIDEARKHSPNALLVSYAQALLDSAEGRDTAARDGIQKVLKQAPEHLPSILLAGAVELKLGSVKQAELHLRKYLEAAPNNVYARKLLAQALLRNSQPADAVEVLAPSLDDENVDAQLLTLAGETYMQSQNFDKAAGYFEKAIALAPDAAPLRTSLGVARMGQGQIEKGIADLRRAVELDPKSASSLTTLIQAETRLQNFDNAVAAVARLEKLQPDSVAPQQMKAVVYAAKGDLAGARAAWEKALAMQPTFFPAVAGLARLDLAAKDPASAKKRFESYLEKDKKHFGSLVALAELAMLEKKPEVATQMLERAQAENPDTIAAVLKLGGHYLATKQADKALALARTHQAQHPANADLLDLLGQSQMATNQHAAAVETFNRLVNVLPKSGFAQLRLAQAQSLAKNETAAAAALKRAVELQPDLLQARIAQVELAIRRGKADEAMALVRQVQKDQPKLPNGYLLEGDLQLALKKPAEALAAYDKAFAIQKSSGLLVRSVGILRQMGRNAEAQQRLSQWLKQHPDDIQAQMYQADIYLAANQPKPAIAVLQNVLKQMPNNVPALNNLAWALQQEKDPRALATAEKAYSLAGDNPAILDTLGWVLVEGGNTTRGVPLLKKAVDLSPKAPETRYHLAVGLHKAGDKQGARKELETLLAQNTPFPQMEAARTLLKSM